MHDNPTRRRRVLVTGASGRIDRHVVDALADDHEVTVLDLVPPVQDVAFIEGNVLELDTVRASTAGQDAVIHLAGVDIDVPAEPEAYFSTNVMGTWNARSRPRVKQASARWCWRRASRRSGSGRCDATSPPRVPARRRGCENTAISLY